MPMFQCLDTSNDYPGWTPVEAKHAGEAATIHADAINQLRFRRTRIVQVRPDRPGALPVAFRVRAELNYTTSRIKQ